MDSIYEQILAAVGPDGSLPASFELQTEDSTPGIQLDKGPLAGQKVRFAPGAQDGINFFHGGWGPDQEQLELMKQAIERIVQDDPDGAFACVENCFQGRDGMLACVDGLQEWIAAHQEELDPNVLLRFSSFLASQGGSVGAVKFGLSILELLAVSGGKWRDHVRTLALHDEFTLFCVFIIRYWDNRDEELFSIAQKVRGWGRVHAVRVLEPVTQVMRDWLLDEGWNNGVLPSYTALKCAQAGGLRQRLEGEALSRTQLDAADGLIRALLDEGPVQNISQMEDAEELLLVWLDQAERVQPNEEDQKTLQALREEAGDRDWPRLWARLDRMEG